ncbi:MAG: DHH family phosphoesterase, partial [Anaerolineae bacterium]
MPRPRAALYNASVKVIATHENTDFDGFSALVAADRLFPAALAVVPRHLNRNVRDFFTLYQDQLRLHQVEDLPQEPVETLILVDTQTPPPLRGVGESTDYVIIDHHSLDRSLSHATYEVEATGAATTLLVERLQEAGYSPTSVEASLFVLGIYEDTGNLAYPGTTPRDVRSVAYLLEQGANLQLVDRFLSYPLTDEQRQLYNQLVHDVQMVEVEGAVIGIGAARSDHYVEEVSVLAHRLRDLFEPDALFILVEMADHVQLVARSSNGGVNVGTVAAHFGGGGHRRAAAALIRGHSVEEVRSRLIAYLPNAVEPPKRVRHIMSYGVHVLAPDTKVAEAAFLMQRYGH